MGVRVPDSARIIGANLKYLREACGLSQQDIAHLLGVTHQQIQKYERGTNRFPVEKLFMLKQFYSVPYDLFFRDLSHADGCMDLLASLRHLNAFRELNNLKDRDLKLKIQQIILILLKSES